MTKLYAVKGLETIFKYSVVHTITVFMPEVNKEMAKIEITIAVFFSVCVFSPGWLVGF